jgi:hypothetical protein
VSNRRKPKVQPDLRCPSCGAEAEQVRADDGLHLIRAHHADCPVLLLMDPATLSTGWIEDGDGYSLEREVSP